MQSAIDSFVAALFTQWIGLPLMQCSANHHLHLPVLQTGSICVSILVRSKAFFVVLSFIVEATEFIASNVYNFAAAMKLRTC